MKLYFQELLSAVPVTDPPRPLESRACLATDTVEVSNLPPVSASFTSGDTCRRLQQLAAPQGGVVERVSAQQGTAIIRLAQSLYLVYLVDARLCV